MNSMRLFPTRSLLIRYFDFKNYRYFAFLLIFIFNGTDVTDAKAIIMKFKNIVICRCN